MNFEAGKALESLPSGRGAAGFPGNGQFSAGRGQHTIPSGRAPRAPLTWEGSVGTGSSAFKNLSKRGYSYCGTAKRPICHSAGVRSESHSQGYIDPFDLGTRMFKMQRFCDFAKRNKLEVREENVPLF
ncbi:hypothetical protein DQ04_09651040 [Trypanosoma grayi]|uniref:hypothetical protein n=1 Tax=Trypanosoma grayi TaxID=71804 RepID=UPI0004F47BFC|nr:hypothetical protein DQ04_09651040 [Trypanosoma grayi]KEG07489.1 hypothetical protein DQ04_09651040 [Trypanosoma grayi]